MRWDGKMRNDDSVKIFELPFARHYDNLEVSQDYFIGFTRIIMRSITEKIEELGLTYLFQDYNRFSLVGKQKAMKKFLKWYKSEIIKYRGLRLI